MRVGVLTSVETRHRYFVNTLRERFEVMAVGYERIGYSHADIQGFDLTPEEQAVVAHHFAERARQEELFFGAKADFVENSPSCAVLRIEPGKLNSRQTLDLLTSAGVDVVAIFGTNMIRDPL